MSADRRARQFTQPAWNALRRIGGPAHSADVRTTMAAAGHHPTYEEARKACLFLVREGRAVHHADDSLGGKFEAVES